MQSSSLAAVTTATETTRGGPEPVVLHLDGVSKAFGRIAAVESAMLSIQRGEYVTVVGPSGSGKTTILRAVAGLEVPDSGDIYIGGLNASRLPSYRRNLGVVFQGYALFPNMNVRDNVAYSLRMRGVGKRERRGRADDLLTRVGLPGLGDRKPFQLSGGQQQRVALARALAPDPPVLLLDEPLSALDRALRDEMRIELREIQQRFNVAVLHVTHDQEEALSLGDRVVVMTGGRIVQVGSPQEVYERPAHPFVARFVGGGLIVPAEVIDAGGGAASGANARARFGDNMIDISCSDPVNVGDRGTVVVRSEWFDVSASQRDSGGMAATVSSATYLGSCTDLTAEVGGSGGLRLRVGTDEGERYRAGNVIRLEQRRPAWYISDKGDGA